MSKAKSPGALLNAMRKNTHNVGRKPSCECMKCIICYNREAKRRSRARKRDEVTPKAQK